MKILHFKDEQALLNEILNVRKSGCNAVKLWL
uniref:54S ribosomal protein L8 n=1 Tax=Siphoviridae sp. ctHip2 TaxID=2827830 RepID=A0A8S5RVP1_9CAUD|nr:MAG TPA: 54S ribosomal protein L8 [Siphoviridae sp. ctHip2]